jgi:hypothetical protein
VSDKFAYRVRVWGPDLDEYLRSGEATKIPRDDMLYWDGPRVRGTEHNLVFSGYWYNATSITVDDDGPNGRVHQILGNFSSAPVWFFMQPGAKRSMMERLDGGPFDGLMLHVEIVGMSTDCDVPTGKYSYRTVLCGGKISGDDSWTSLKAAIDYAPDLYEFARSSS